MEDRKLSVTLTGPAKIDGVREPAGKTVSVTTALALQLAASGVINPDDVEGAVLADLPDTALETDFQQAVDRAAEEKAKALASSLVETAVWGAVETAKADIANLEKELATYRQSLETEAKARTEAETKLAEAQAELAKLTKPDDQSGKDNDSKSGKSTK